MTRVELEQKIEAVDDRIWWINMADRFTDADRKAYDEASQERRELLNQWFALTGEHTYKPLNH